MALSLREKYERFLEKTYGPCDYTRIGSDEAGCRIYMEPGAYEELRTYFHTGRLDPLSMYEQQVGLAGFYLGEDFVVRYVFPSFPEVLSDKEAIFSERTLSAALKCVKIIRDNMKASDDANLPGASRITFLGFAHSHPSQPDLGYSLGDEIIHRKMIKRFGRYIGILVYPKEELIGAYSGKDILQAELVIVSRRSKD